MNIAITGTGFMGAVHAEALKRLHLNVIGIHGSSPKKSLSASAELSIPRAYEDYQKLISDPDVDAVHITTPNRHHFPMAMAALEAGKHVLCEKPLAMTSSESATLAKLASSKELAAGVNYNIRFYPLCLETRHRLKTGTLGDVHSIMGSYAQDWLLYETDYNWRVLAEEGGKLRAIADIGTHLLDLVQSMTGLKVTEILADLHTIHPTRQRPQGEVQTFTSAQGETQSVPIETEDLGTLLLRFDNGAKGSLFVSQATAGRKNCLRYEIAGRQGSVAWNSEEPNVLWLGHRDKPNETLVKDPFITSAEASSFTAYPGGHAEGFPDTFKMCFRAFYDYIAAGDFTAPHSFPTFEDGHREIVLCEAVLKSHEEERWVQV